MKKYHTEDDVTLARNDHPDLKPLPGVSYLAHLTVPVSADDPACTDPADPRSHPIRVSEGEAARWQSEYETLKRILEATEADVAKARQDFEQAVHQANYQRRYALRFYLPIHEEIDRRRAAALGFSPDILEPW